MPHVKPWQICAVAAFTLAALVPAVTAAASGSDDDYGRETRYGNPSETSVRKAPDGYTMIFIESVGRHGARSMTSNNTEEDALRLWRAAEKKKALTETGTRLERDIERFQQAEKKVGYGELSGLGREEMRGLGRRTGDNYASFFSSIRKRSETVATQTSEVTRTKQSVYSLRNGLEDGFGRTLDSVLAKPSEEDDLLRFDNEASSAGEAATDRIRNRGGINDRARHVLSTSYKRSFVESIDDPLDAALDLYSLYAVAPSMQKETSISFARYVPREDRWALSYATDAKWFYRYGPGVKGETNTYSRARPLLDDFFTRLDRRMGGGSTAAVFRVGHAETTMPFAALIKAPGSEKQAPKWDPYHRDNNPWRGSVAGRLSGNIEWTAFRSRDDGRVIVTMRYNEKPVRFHSGCSPYKKDSYFYRVPELRDCLG